MCCNHHNLLIWLITFGTLKIVFLQRIVEHPTDALVVEGDSVVLRCLFSSSVDICRWSKNDALQADIGLYSYIGNPIAGSCSIRIDRADISKHGGWWRCFYEHNDRGRPNIVYESMSRLAFLTVAVAPSPPYFTIDSLNTKRYYDTFQMPVGREGRSVTISCIAEKGFPSPLLEFESHGYGLVRGVNVTYPDSVQNLYTTESRWDMVPTRNMDRTWLSCISHHPAYRGNPAISKVFLDVQYEARDIRYMSPNRITVYPERLEIAFCVARGNPPPEYVWEYRRDVHDWNDYWQTHAGVQNLTFNWKGTVQGYYRCRAGNVWNRESIIAEPYIYVERSGFVAAWVFIVGCAVIGVLLFGGICVCFIYCKRKGCFASESRSNSLIDSPLPNGNRFKSPAITTHGNYRAMSLQNLKEADQTTKVSNQSLRIQKSQSQQSLSSPRQPTTPSGSKQNLYVNGRVLSPSRRGLLDKLADELERASLHGSTSNIYYTQHRYYKRKFGSTPNLSLKKANSDKSINVPQKPLMPATVEVSPKRRRKKIAVDDNRNSVYYFREEPYSSPKKLYRNGSNGLKTAKSQPTVGKASFSTTDEIITSNLDDTNDFIVNMYGQKVKSTMV